MRRRPYLKETSLALVEYLVNERGMSQNEIAEVLLVDKSFVSRVRSSERQLSPMQMEMLAQHLDVPLGALLIATTKPSERSSDPDIAKIQKMCEDLLRLADRATDGLRESIEQRRKRKAS